MSALLRKEIRLLLPSFSVALLLAFSVWLIPQDADSASRLRFTLLVLPFLCCPALVVMMALDSFGREIGSGTFSNLLSQPITRSHIWRAKTVLLATALAIILGAWWLSFLLHAPFRFINQSLSELTITTVLIVLTAFSGGLWTVLLFRQVAAAFWFTVIVPAALAMSVTYFTEKYGDVTSLENNLILVLAAYSIAGFFWARQMFLRAQDTQWTGGEIAMPRWLKLPRLFVRREGKQSRHTHGALLMKEFQLHQSQLVIAGVLALLHLGMIAARKLGDGFTDSPMLEFLTGQFWILWIVMPLLLGCAAIAEERKLGTMEAQLCLSARRRTQFAIKFLVVLALSFGIGVIVPLLFEGRRILPDMQYTIINYAVTFNGQVHQGSLLLLGLRVIKAALPVLPQFAIVTGVAAISFYASTFARNTLQTLAPAVLGIVVISILVITGSDPEAILSYPLWRGWLVYLIGVPVLTFTLAWLSYWNFKHVLVGWPVLRRNAIVVFASLLSVVTVTSAIYHRVWELISPIEPAHGAARLSTSENVRIWNDQVWNGRGNFIVRLPSGRIWTDAIEFKGPSFGAMLVGDRRSFELFPGGRFLDGTNWSSFAICNGWEAIGTKSDGSLWVSEQPPGPMTLPQSGWRTSDPAKLVKFGDDNSWKSVARESYTSAALLKKDGTLWRLGTNRFDWKKPWPGLRAFELQRLGADADWAEIIFDGNQTCFRKPNGEAWRFASRAGSVTNLIRLDENTWLCRVSDQEFASSQGGIVASFRTRTYPNNCVVGVRRDGTFRVTGIWQQSTKGLTWAITEQDIQIGKETNWIAVAGNFETVVTLKADGSLWKWTFSDDPKTNPDAASCVRLGTHSDWVAIGNVLGNIISLAADGSLWSWQFEPISYYRSSEVDTLPILRASRKPQKIANIFNEAK